MDYYAVIDTVCHRIIANYYSDKGEDRTKPGPDYDQSKLSHLVVPVDVMNDPFLTVIYENDAYTFQQDTVAKARSITEQWAYLREVRNKKLADCDWRMTVSDRPISTEEREAWALYRQQLRDLPSVLQAMPENSDGLMLTIWPIAPDAPVVPVPPM